MAITLCWTHWRSQLHRLSGITTTINVQACLVLAPLSVLRGLEPKRWARRMSTFIARPQCPRVEAWRVAYLFAVTMDQWLFSKCRHLVLGYIWLLASVNAGFCLKPGFICSSLDSWRKNILVRRLNFSTISLFCIWSYLIDYMSSSKNLIKGVCEIEK